MQAQRYETTAIILHWLIAALIAIAFALGLTVDSFPKPMTSAVINLHALIGIAILALTLARLGWRLTHRPPELGAASSPLIRTMSKVVHVLLYALMILVPLIGFPTLFYRGRGLDFGVLQIAPFLPRTPEIYRPLTEFHEYAAFALVGLAAGHVLAALYHQFVLKDGLMARMAPARSP
jgi:cytochrome b561